MSFQYYAFGLILATVSVLGENFEYGPVINSTSGLVRGFKHQTSHGKHVLAYFGVPFAEPLTARRRYMRPLPVKRKDGIFSATEMPNSCQQLEYPGTAFIPALAKWAITTPISEDCLYLNIWTPMPTEDNKLAHNKTVMIWLYGGAFTKGSIVFPQYNGSGIVAEEDVIFVTINYRISAFGYLFLNHPEIPGNGGLYDQLMGLQWVHENIEKFGGNPDKITVAGESAGAASAGLLLISPLNQYFKRAILESGSATAAWATLSRKEAMRRSLEVAKAVGCPYDLSNKQAVVDCLITVDPAKLLDNEPNIPDGVSFAPIVDGYILTKDPKEHLKDIRGKNYDVMLGTNTNEGTIFFMFLVPEVFDFFSNTAFLSRDVFMETIKQYSPYRGPEAIEAMEFFYGEWAMEGDPKSNISYQNNLDAMVTDYYFVCRGHETANAITEAGGKSFVYKYEHRTSHSHFPEWLGVFHSHELQYVFGDPLYRGAKYKEDERLFGRQIVRMWANFAKNGDPNRVGDDFNDPLESAPKWPRWSLQDYDYIRLSAKSITTAKNLRRRHCRFMDHYVPQLLKETKKLYQTVAFYKAYTNSLNRKNDNSLGMAKNKSRLFFHAGS